MNLTDNEKMEIIKYRHEDQSALLQAMTNIDIRIFSGFLTLQLLLGGFIVQADNLSFINKLGLLLIDTSIAMVITSLLYRNNQRRKEVVETISNCNTALKLNEVGFYFLDEKINADTKFRPWYPLYFIAVVISLIGVGIILFGVSPTQKALNDGHVHIIIGSDTTTLKTNTITISTDLKKTTPLATINSK